jgi:hypothetical protein
MWDMESMEDIDAMLEINDSIPETEVKMKQGICIMQFNVVQISVVYCDVTEQNRVAMSRHRHNVASRHYDGSRRCCYSGVN